MSITKKVVLSAGVVAICSALVLFIAMRMWQHATPVSLTGPEGDPLASLPVSCDVSDDLGGAKALHLRVDNPSGRRFDDVSITFDESYTARLQDLRVYPSPAQGSPPLGRPGILPGDNLEIVFSHDVSNHQNMANQSGAPLPVTLVPTHITIDAQGTSATWRVK